MTGAIRLAVDLLETIADHSLAPRAIEMISGFRSHGDQRSNGQRFDGPLVVWTMEAGAILHPLARRVPA